MYTKAEVICMKTNISELMNIIADEEKKFTNITSHIEEMIFNETIIELDGTANVIKDYKKDFDEALMEQENILKKISNFVGHMYLSVVFSVIALPLGDREDSPDFK